MSFYEKDGLPRPLTHYTTCKSSTFKQKLQMFSKDKIKEIKRCFLWHSYLQSQRHPVAIYSSLYVFLIGNKCRCKLWVSGFSFFVIYFIIQITNKCQILAGMANITKHCVVLCLLRLHMGVTLLILVKTTIFSCSFKMTAINAFKLL